MQEYKDNYAMNAAEKWESLNASDNFIFAKMMQNEQICKGLIETLLNISIDRIEYPETEKTIDIATDSKSVRLDVYVNDGKGTIYDIEMQTTDQPYLAKRSRYYQAMIDLNTIEKGQIYDKLKESYVIFICTFDPFEQNKAVYKFENRCEDQPELRLKDGTYKFFYNTKTDETENEDLKQVLDFFDNILPEEPTNLIRQMTEEVLKIKSNEKWRMEYMTLYLKEQEDRQRFLEEGISIGRTEGINIGRTEGINIGRTEGINEILANMQKAGFSQEMIALALGTDKPLFSATH